MEIGVLLINLTLPICSRKIGCSPSQAYRQGNVGVVNTPGTINSNVDMTNSCGSSFAGGVEPAGVPRKIRLVNAINWCGTTSPNIIGCSPTPGTCVVVVRFTASQEGILWTHEFGHSKGLPHRTDDPNAIMQPIISPTRTVFNQTECNAIRQLGFFEFHGLASQTVNQTATMKVPIQDFVMQTFAHGVPYEEARQYNSTDLNSIIPWLSQNDKMAYWSNVVTVIGIVADNRSSAVLRKHISSPGSGLLPLDDYKSRVSAIISLGYVVNGNKDREARAFLNTHNTPASWVGTTWRAPYHTSDDERNIDLAAADVLGLGLIGDKLAEDALASALSAISTDDKYASLAAAIRQAKDSNAAIEKGGLRGYYSIAR